MLSLGILCLLPLAQTEAQSAGAASHDRVIVLEIKADDPVVEGHGHGRSVEYTADFGGGLHAWVRSPTGLDTMLRVDAAGGRRYEDDDSGGRPNPYLPLRVWKGTKIVLTVFASKPDVVGTAELHLHATPETEATLAAAASAKAELAEIRKLREARDFDAAVARLNTLGDHLLVVEGVATSDAIEDQIGDATNEYYSMRSYGPLERLLRFKVKHLEGLLPEDHERLLKSRMFLAVTLRHNGNEKESCQILEGVLGSVRRTLIERDDLYQATLLNLAVSTAESGDRVAACALEKELVAIRLRQFSPESEPVLEARDQLASTMQEMGDLEGARASQEQIVKDLSRTQKEDSLLLLIAETNLANTLNDLGNLVRARDLKKKVLEVFSRTMPTNSEDVRRSKVNLSATLIKLGDLDSARALLESALDRREEKTGSTSRVMPVARLNLASVLSEQGDLEGARKSLEEMLSEYVSRLPENDVNLIKVRQELAVNCFRLERYEEAFKLAQAVFEGLSKALSAEHPDVIASQALLAELAICRRDFESARRLSDEVLELRTRVLPEGDPDLQTARMNCARLIAVERSSASNAASTPPSNAEANQKRFSELVSAGMSGLERYVKTVTLSSSHRETEAVCAGLEFALERALSMASGYGIFPDVPALEREAFSLSEAMRGAALTSARLLREARDPSAVNQLRLQLTAASTDIARLSQGGSPVDDIHAAVARRDRAEQEILKLLGEDVAAKLVRPDADALASCISPRTAVVAFRRYNHASFATGAGSGTERDEVCAFVVRRVAKGTGADLTRVELGPTSAITAAVRAWRNAIGATIERSMPPGASGLAADSGANAELERGRELRRLVLDPLLPALGDADHLIVALDDVLHLVPLDALPLDPPQKAARGTPELVGERWRIEMRTTLSELLQHAAAPSGSGLLCALGGAFFDLEPVPLDGKSPLVAAAEAPTNRGPSLMQGGKWERGFPPLPNTGPEAHGVETLFREAFGETGSSQILEARKASREALVEFAPRTRWLHVATHGWFAPESVRSWSDAGMAERREGGAPRLDRDAWVRGMSPMLLCGLALAGANLPEDAVGRVPGILTAEEVSAVDLGQCELAVLSACDTNVGEQRAGQGIASLQKALQMAGARSAITSLWKVPDEATRELMLDFYRRLWILKKPKWEALWESKLHLRAERDDAGRPRHSTRAWAAWVLTGDPD